MDKGIPKPGTFYELLRWKLGQPHKDGSPWRDALTWVNHSTTYDFHSPDLFGYTWGLPILVPTCPRKLFEQGPRDIVTDTLHASSSDTWNTLAMVRLKLQEYIPATARNRQCISWLVWQPKRTCAGYTSRLVRIRCNSADLIAWRPVSIAWIRRYDVEESSAQFATYVWSEWISKAVQPMHTWTRVSWICSKVLTEEVQANAVLFSLSLVVRAQGILILQARGAVNLHRRQPKLRMILWVVVPRSHHQTREKGSVLTHQPAWR